MSNFSPRFLLVGFGLLTTAVGVFFAVAGSDTTFVAWPILAGGLILLSGFLDLQKSVPKALVIIGTAAATFWWFAFLWYLFYGAS